MPKPFRIQTTTLDSVPSHEQFVVDCTVFFCQITSIHSIILLIVKVVWLFFGGRKKSSQHLEEKASQWEAAIALLQEMIGRQGEAKQKIAPNIFSFNAAISACEKAAKWPFSLCLLEKMLEIRLQMDVISLNAAISSCEKAGEWQQALVLFYGMLNWKLQRDLISYSAVISCCEKAGQWQQALHLLRCYKLERFLSLQRTAVVLKELTRCFFFFGGVISWFYGRCLCHNQIWKWGWTVSWIC